VDGGSGQQLSAAQFLPEGRCDGHQGSACVSSVAAVKGGGGQWAVVAAMEVDRGRGSGGCVVESDLIQGCTQSEKKIQKTIQRVQRQCAGYYCGYTFKPQPVGKKFLRAAATSLNYLTTGMADKTQGQKWHRITHRSLLDWQHRVMRRTAPEEWNLSAYHNEEDITDAEFVRTYMSISFPGGTLLRRLEAELSGKDSTSYKRLPERDSTQPEKCFQHFDDLYGYRGNHWAVFLLSPWEFLSLFEVVEKPPGSNIVSAADGSTVLFPPTSGENAPHKHFYMRRRIRPMVPAPTNTPMPSKETNSEKKGRLYCLYMRPWVLDFNYATCEVPHITLLNCVPDKVRLSGTASKQRDLLTPNSVSVSLCTYAVEPDPVTIPLVRALARQCVRSHGQMFVMCSWSSP